MKYVLSSVSFESEEHEKAWFIRVTINACKDLLKSFFRNHTVSLDEIINQSADLPDDNREVLEAVLSLPQKYRQVVYLHYYEGYTAVEIGEILGKNVNTVYTLLTRSRQMLRKSWRVTDMVMDMNDKLNEKLKDVFDQVQAEEDLKEKPGLFLHGNTGI